MVDSSGLRLMAVHAHPDDESSKGAATMARYAAEGADVLVVTCTGGERGDVLNPALAADPTVQADLARLRREEMARAAALLGVRQHWLGFVDSGLPEGDPLPPLPDGCFALVPLEAAARPLVEQMRAFRPHVVLTYDELGGYPHPDHIATHAVSVEAFRAAGDPAAYPGTGQAWAPLKLYYHQTFTKERVQALHAAALAEGVESPFADWLDGWDDRERRPQRVTTRVQCAPWFDVRDAALKAHASQVDPSGSWFALPLDLQAAAWPTEDYELAQSAVAVTVPEDDLFAGVREDPDARERGAVAVSGGVR